MGYACSDSGAMNDFNSCTHGSILLDIISTWIKYTEGFMPLPNGDIITKPFAFWDEYHQSFIQPIDYVQCISFALQTGVFFLLQCFWHYLSNSVARRSFMGSWEFRFYIVWAVCSMAMFPILQWRFNEDQYKSEAVPQLAYGLEGNNTFHSMKSIYIFVLTPYWIFIDSAYHGCAWCSLPFSFHAHSECYTRTQNHTSTRILS